MIPFLLAVSSLLLPGLAILTILIPASAYRIRIYCLTDTVVLVAPAHPHSAFRTKHTSHAYLSEIIRRAGTFPRSLEPLVPVNRFGLYPAGFPGCHRKENNGVPYQSNGQGSGGAC